ncbi:MAG: sulfoxide reductase heme-binding subunit YedZ [Proteobacteria bacterium]|nr:sulfoxide reductase heme-binding subunit YedZ [Pseudomonadota bacterium]HQR04919.1 protein-methionine-sulfoxide reductase heme-binding subunit MsrQ [Rhodocyclaceae bacterium]
MQRTLPYLKAVLFLLCLVPLAHIGWRFYQDDLGANPVEALTRGLGTWGLNFLLITLAITPARRITGWHWLLRLRRMFGLYAFCYITLHLTSYLWLDQDFDWHEVAKDILKHPFITAGMAAYALMVPLAATSTNAMVRRLGGRRWQSLHRSVYAIGILAILHYTWLVKLDVTQPLLYGLVLALLLGLRALWRSAERKKQLAGGYAPQPTYKGKRVIPITVKRGP